MGSRSRKRARAAPGAASPDGATAHAAPERSVPPAVSEPEPPALASTALSAALDEFSAIAPPPEQPTEAEGPQAPSAKRLRGEAANQAVRAGLEPLGEGERPPALRVAVAVTFLLGVGNLVAYLLGAQVDGKTPPVTGIIGFASIMLIMAWGMWTLRYWAILGFQALLALIVVIFALIMPTASNLQAVAVCAVVVGLGGWLFWKLVRVMSRVQMPERPGPSNR